MRIKSRYKASSRIAKRGKIRKTLSLYLKIGAPLFLLVGFVFAMRMQFFQIKGVNIVGNQGVPTEQVAAAVQGMLSGNYLHVVPRTNFLLISEKDIERKLADEFSRISDIDVSHDLSGNIEVNIKERLGQFLWCDKQNICYLMTNDGLVFDRASGEDMGGKLTFKGNIQGNPVLQNFASAEKMRDYESTVQKLNDAGLIVSSIEVEDPNKSVFKTIIGDIFLNPEENMANALPNALLLVDEIKFSDPEAKFEYIDARFGKKLFYRLVR